LATHHAAHWLSAVTFSVFCTRPRLSLAEQANNVAYAPHDILSIPSSSSATSNGMLRRRRSQQRRRRNIIKTCAKEGQEEKEEDSDHVSA